MTTTESFIRGFTDIYEPLTCDEWDLYEEALTYPNNKKLAYIGDAVVDLIVKDFVFKKCYTKTLHGLHTSCSGWTNRQGILENKTFAEVMKKTDVDSVMWDVSGRIAEDQKTKVYGTVFEAIVGVLYLTRGLDKTSLVVYKHLLTNLDRCINGQRNKAAQEAEALGFC